LDKYGNSFDFPGFRRAQSVQLWAMDWMFDVRFLAGARDFSFLHTGSGAHPASSSVGSGGSFPGINWLGCEADHSPQPSAEVWNVGAIPPLPQGQLSPYHLDGKIVLCVQ
jgi:hypothetical protein